MPAQKKTRVKNDRKARGKIEDINSKSIRGWVYLENDESPEIKAVLNGVKCALVKPEVDRPELQKKIGTSRRCGFVIDLTASNLLERQKTNYLEIIEVNTGYNFGRDVHHICPLVRKQTNTLKSLFFAEFYRKRYDVEALSNEEAFKHYIQYGIYQDHNPNPWFSSEYFRQHYSHKLKNIDIPILAYINFEGNEDVKASEYFCPTFYAKQNVDLSADYGFLNHYVNYGHLEGRGGIDATLPDVITKETEHLSTLEPQLALYFNTRKTVIEYPTLRGSTYIPRLIRNKLGNDIRVVVCVPYLSCGGADLISTYLLKAYQQTFGADHVLLIVTDKPKNAVPQWISENTRTIFLDEEAEYADLDEKVATLHSVIGLLSPEKIVNVNSHACWEMYRIFGRQLASVIDLYAYLFCFDYTADLRVDGYIVNYIPKTIKYLKTVFCDNQTVIDDMQRLYGFSHLNHDVFKAVYVPIPDELTQIKNSSKKISPYEKKILWVSRLARQKQPEILLQIAEDMPDYEFVVYGPPGDSAVSAKITNNDIHNIEYRGVFENIADLSLDEYSLFLNTSAWDGLPTILIQIMGAGLPIVTSNAGGISELVNDETGSLVLEHDNSAGYSIAIKSALIGYKESLGKAQKGLEVIHSRHNWDAFLERLTSIGAFDNTFETTRRIIPSVEQRKYGS